ncbi:MAG TPA: fasciclin domain-containing protein [Phycisphaerae bacterium]|nr:fasciclin domain-containing protein [Phycisphaerae bacterium]
MDAPKNIIETATGPGMADVTTLVTAVKAAGLVDTLEGKGPFTVFAPTNAAFDKLPKATLEMLLKPENKDKLVKILTYHVVAGDDDAKALMGMSSVKTVEGDELKITTKDGKVMVGNDKTMATVIKPDIKCTNGTIHWIDTVLMPE